MIATTLRATSATAAPRLIASTGLRHVATVPTVFNNATAQSRFAHTFVDASQSCSNPRYTAVRPRLAPVLVYQQQLRFISLSSPEDVKSRADPAKDDAPRTPTLFNPVYTEDELRSVKVVNFQAANTGDRVAEAAMRLARWGFDLVTRYKHAEKFPRVKNEQQRVVSTPAYDPRKPTRDARTSSLATDGSASSSAAAADSLPDEMTVEEMRQRGLVMTPESWLTRIVFLESIAGVPGFAAAMVRHLQSLRLMRRDKAWIRTLLEDAENERMHLQTAIELAKPGPFMRLAILLAQGVFTNGFFLAYLFAPRICHRFVGCLEQEAVLTYTRAIADVEEGRVPEWENLPAPAIAKEYWRLPNSAKWLDVLYAIRADESTHRLINHSLANLDQKNDYNPFAHKMPPAKIRGELASLSKEEAKAWADEARHAFDKASRGEASGETMATPSSHKSTQLH